MTATRSEALQVIAIVAMSAASAFCGSRVQKAFDSEELEVTQRTLEFVAKECEKSDSTSDHTHPLGGFKLPSPRPSK